MAENEYNADLCLVESLLAWQFGPGPLQSGGGNCGGI